MEYTERHAIELQVVERIIDTALAAGFSLGVYNGEELVIHHSKDKAAVLGEMFSVDEENLRIYGQDGKRIGSVFLVYGNDGWDVISNLSDSLEAMIDPIVDWANDQSELSAHFEQYAAHRPLF